MMVTMMECRPSTPESVVNEGDDDAVSAIGILGRRLQFYRRHNSGDNTVDTQATSKVRLRF